MRTRTLVATALLALPCALSAQQRPPVPRTGGLPPTIQPAPLPREIPAVTRALVYRRSRWSSENYTSLNSVHVPAAGGARSYTTLGVGSHADYRATDHWSATMDIATSLFNTSVNTLTAEVGTRYRPMPWGERMRPFVDLRASYMRLNEAFLVSPELIAQLGGSSQGYVEGSRYGRGFGAVGGAGLEYWFMPSFAVTSELSAVRNRMTAYRQTYAADIPRDGTDYWATSFRYTLGLKFNPVRALHLAQNPRQ